MSEDAMDAYFCHFCACTVISERDEASACDGILFQGGMSVKRVSAAPPRGRAHSGRGLERSLSSAGASWTGGTTRPAVASSCGAGAPTVALGGGGESDQGEGLLEGLIISRKALSQVLVWALPIGRPLS